jgi:hypothetical protein
VFFRINCRSKLSRFMSEQYASRVCHSWTDREDDFSLLRRPQFDILRHFWARTHQAHVASQNIDELWQLVQLAVAKDSTDRSNSTVSGYADQRPVVYHSHRAKLMYSEGVSVNANSLLAKEGRPSASDADCDPKDHE